jgi:hypothetical protein
MLIWATGRLAELSQEDLSDLPSQGNGGVDVPSDLLLLEQILHFPRLQQLANLGTLTSRALDTWSREDLQGMEGGSVPRSRTPLGSVSSSTPGRRKRAGSWTHGKENDPSCSTTQPGPAKKSARIAMKQQVLRESTNLHDVRSSLDSEFDLFGQGDVGEDDDSPSLSPAQRMESERDSLSWACDEVPATPWDETLVSCFWETGAKNVQIQRLEQANQRLRAMLAQRGVAATPEGKHPKGGLLRRNARSPL